MKTCKAPLTRLARALQAGTALSAVILTSSALQAQSYSRLQCAGVTTPAGVTQDAGLPMPLGATQTPPPLFMYPAEMPPTLRSTDPKAMKDFLRESARETQTEISLADIAQARAQSAGVKQLAESVRTDEARNRGLLHTLAHQHGIKLATSLGVSSQREMECLEGAGTGQFDRIYTKMILARDVKGVNSLEKAAQNIMAPDVAAYAVVNLPRLRNELSRTEDAARYVGVDQDTIASILKELPSEDRGIALSDNKQNNSITSR
jgi:predicted outer membrane protein